MSEKKEPVKSKDQLSLKEAAEALGLAYTTVHQYVIEGRIRSERLADVYVIHRDDIQKFQRNIAGRPRTTVPQWRISPNENALQHTFIQVQIRPGKVAEFRKKLDEVRRQKAHPFVGTTSRFILGSEIRPEQVMMILIWRLSVMPDEADRAQALEAFKVALDDVVDWSTAHIDSGIVYMHA